MFGNDHCQMGRTLVQVVMYCQIFTTYFVNSQLCPICAVVLCQIAAHSVCLQMRCVKIVLVYERNVALTDDKLFLTTSTRTKATIQCVQVLAKVKKYQ